MVVGSVSSMAASVPLSTPASGEKLMWHTAEAGCGISSSTA